MKKFLIILTIIFMQTASFADEEIIKLINIKIQEIGEFKEPSKYPPGMEDQLMKGCTSWRCIADKSAKKMGSIFKRTDKYNQKNPGNQIYGMAHFEIFYLNKLKQSESDLKKFKEYWPDKVFKGKTIASLIKTNESRKTMRSALGIDINATTEEALEIYWTLGDFLQRGAVIKKGKVDKSLKKRQKIISEFKGTVGKLKRKIENQDLEKIIEYLES